MMCFLIGAGTILAMFVLIIIPAIIIALMVERFGNFLEQHVSVPNTLKMIVRRLLMGVVMAGILVGFCLVSYHAGCQIRHEGFWKALSH